MSERETFETSSDVQPSVCPVCGHTETLSSVVTVPSPGNYVVSITCSFCATSGQQSRDVVPPLPLIPPDPRPPG